MIKSIHGLAMAVWLCLCLSCGSGGGGTTDDGITAISGNTDVVYTVMTDDMPAAGNPDGNWPIPDEAMEEDTSSPDHVIGDGTPQSCTSEAVVNAVAQGGIITFGRNNTNHSNHPWEILPGISGHDDTTLIVDDVSIIE